MSRSVRLAGAVVIALLCCLRLAHSNVLWADEDYHIAAALHALAGRIPYRDFWYDKPPLTALYYLLNGAHGGLSLRLLDAAYAAACCAMIERLGRWWKGPAEGIIAALLLAFYLAFYLPSAVVAFAADALLLLPHIAAIYFAVRHRPLLAGIACGAGFLANIKALFVLASCSLFLWPDLLWLGTGFSGISLASVSALLFAGAWPGYMEQVWRWGARYAAGSPEAQPIATGFARTMHWAGFHLALVAGATADFLKTKRWQLGGWLLLSFAAVALGGRFAPHYYLQLLPPLVLTSACGITAAYRERPRLVSVFIAITLAIPLIRFGPRYATLAFSALQQTDPHWSDLALDLDSQRVATFLNASKQEGDTLLVWGYRPDIYVYSRLISPGLFWDSQPLTGVAADRHLHSAVAIYSGPAQANRIALVQSTPTWLIDGLGLLNAELRPQAYRELDSWLAQYQIVGKTKLSIIYHRRN